MCNILGLICSTKKSDVCAIGTRVDVTEPIQGAIQICRLSDSRPLDDCYPLYLSQQRNLSVN